MLFVVLSLALSFGAGALGGWHSSEISRVALLADEQRISSVDLRPPSPAPAEMALGDIESRVRPSIVTLVKDLKVISAGEQQWSNRVVDTPSITSYAIALTADGWIVAPREVVGIAATRLAVLDFHGRRSVIEKVISDPALGITFIKIAASDLLSASFSSADTHGPVLGYRVTPRNIEVLAISSKTYPPIQLSADAIRSSDRLEKRINTDSSLEGAGLPVVDGQGALLGMTLERGVMPISYIEDAFTRILRTGSLDRPTLKLFYIDGYHTILQHLEGVKGDGDIGTRLISEAKVILVPTSSGVGRLQHWDRIVSVNDELIDGNRSFSELVQGYQKGDVLRVAYQRGTEMGEIKIKL